MQALFEQASALHQSGQLSKAESIYRKLLLDIPGQPVVTARLAILLTQSKRPVEALAYFQEAIAKLPEEQELLLHGSDAALKAGRPDLGAKWLKTVVDANPRKQELVEKLAGIYVAHHDEKGALEYAKQAIKLNPKSANAYNIKGMALCRLGEQKKGYASIQKAVTLDPSLLGAIKNLILFGKDIKEPLLDKIIPQLRANFNSDKQAPVVQMNIGYVLAMYYEKAKRHADFFTCLKAANDINRTTYQYKHEDTLARFRFIKDLFSEERVSSLKSLDGGCKDQTPIFILGMPRSGTTLIEQILSSHSDVKAGGELTELDIQFQRHVETLSAQFEQGGVPQTLVQIGQAYVDNIKSRFNDAKRITDKMPYNFIFIGLIKLALPNAKIILCTRSNLEIGFSIYKQNFAGTHGYTDKLDEIGMYINAYESLITYWHSLFGEDIFEANYETIVDDSENQTKRLLDFCELDHQEACFKFYKNKRAVRTASVAQVRQPIYKSALSASAPYETQLKPLKEALDSGIGGKF